MTLPEFFTSHPWFCLIAFVMGWILLVAPIIRAVARVASKLRLRADDWYVAAIVFAVVLTAVMIVFQGAFASWVNG